MASAASAALRPRALLELGSEWPSSNGSELGLADEEEEAVTVVVAALRPPEVVLPTGTKGPRLTSIGRVSLPGSSSRSSSLRSVPDAAALRDARAATVGITAEEAPEDRVDAAVDLRVGREAVRKSELSLLSTDAPLRREDLRMTGFCEDK